MFGEFTRIKSENTQIRIEFTRISAELTHISVKFAQILGEMTQNSFKMFLAWLLNEIYSRSPGFMIILSFHFPR